MENYQQHKIWYTSTYHQPNYRYIYSRNKIKKKYEQGKQLPNISLNIMEQFVSNVN
jgi:hypothetical protein